MHRIRILITGRVQGVFYRAHTHETARKLKLTGWVRNTPDRKVEVVAEGERPQLEKLIEWCEHGPPLAVVENVAVEWLDATEEFKNFDVSYM